jgi:hypothetical protein
MSKLKLAITNIEALSDTQKSQLVRTGIITIEPTEAEEQLWQVCSALLDRSYIAELIGLHVTTVNTYMQDPYRLTCMKEKLYTVLSKDISQRDITYVHNFYKKVQQISEAKQQEKVDA